MKPYTTPKPPRIDWPGWMSKALSRLNPEREAKATRPQAQSGMAARIKKQAAREKKHRQARLLVGAILRDPPPVIPMTPEWDKRFL